MRYCLSRQGDRVNLKTKRGGSEGGGWKHRVSFGRRSAFLRGRFIHFFQRRERCIRHVARPNGKENGLRNEDSKGEKEGKNAFSAGPSASHRGFAIKRKDTRTEIKI